MDLIRLMHPLARAWLLDGPLSSYIEAFQALLERGRYAEGGSAAALRAWSHFAHWMMKCQLSDRTGPGGQGAISMKFLKTL